MTALPRTARSAPESDPDFGWDLVETALGVIGIAWSRRGVVRLQLPEASVEATAARVSRPVASRSPPPAAIAAVVADLVRYAGGARVDFSAAPLDLDQAPPAHRRIYEITKTLGFGETATYGSIAAAAGPPVIARAVGVAMARNPVPILVPCHRVLAAGGKPGGFSAPGGVATKARLLALEGVVLDAAERDPEQPRLPGIA